MTDAAAVMASPVRVSLLSSSSDAGEDCAGRPGPPQQAAGSLCAADSDDSDTAASFEIIELLDDESDDPDVIELLDSDSEDADDDDDGDVVLVASLPAHTRTAGSSRQQQQQQVPGSLQPPPPPPPRRQPRHAVHIYVDGSHRPHATNRFAMAAGVWAAGGALKLARNLHGGVADSVRAELGAILAAMEHVQAGGLGAAFTARQAAAAAAQAAGRHSAAMPPAPQTAAQPAAVEVHLLTDCQACCNMLGPGERVNPKYVAMVARIRSLKAALPFRVRLFKVKGHSRGRDAHAVGNRAADRLARTCDAHQPLVLLPA